MKKTYYFVLIMALSFLLAGCGSSPSWNVELTSDDTYHPDQPLVFDLNVNEDGKGITGLEAVATLEMKNMDHGTLELEFKEQGEGHYTASGVLPMSGDWEAFVKVTDGQKKLEVIKSITIKE